MLNAFVSEGWAAETASKDAGTQDAATQVPYELSAEKMMTDNVMILALLFFIFYFLLIRPQSRRVKLHKEMMNSLQKGNKVLTGGGIIGTIIKFDGEDLVVVVRG